MFIESFYTFLGEVVVFLAILVIILFIAILIAPILSSKYGIDKLKNYLYI